MSDDRNLTCKKSGEAIVVAVKFPRGQQIADDLILAENSVLFAGAHPAHLPGIANIIRNSKVGFSKVICDQSNVDFFLDLAVEVEVDKFDILIAA